MTFGKTFITVLRLRHVDMNAFDIREMETSERTFLEQFQPRVAFRSVADISPVHMRIFADQEFNILLHLLNRLDLETDMV